MQSDTHTRSVSNKRLSARSIMNALPVLLLLCCVLVCSAEARQGLARVAYLESRALGISELGLSIVTRCEGVGGNVDGSDGVAGASLHSNPREDMVAILMTPRAWPSSGQQNICLDFWSSVYQAFRD